MLKEILTIQFLSKTRQQIWRKQANKNRLIWYNREDGEKNEKGKLAFILIVERGQDLKNETIGPYVIYVEIFSTKTSKRGFIYLFIAHILENCRVCMLTRSLGYSQAKFSSGNFTFTEIYALWFPSKANFNDSVPVF